MYPNFGAIYNLRRPDRELTYQIQKPVIQIIAAMALPF